MQNHGLGSWPTRRRRLSPSRVALAHGDEKVTYAELDARCSALSTALCDLGVKRGDRVAYLGPNHPTLIETLFATTALGAIFVPLNWRLTAPELTYIIGDSGANVLVHASDFTGTAGLIAGDASTELSRTIELGRHYEDLLASAAAPASGDGGDGGFDLLNEPVSLDDPALIIYTSGTTGRPKGATLTHGNVTWNCVNVLIDTYPQPDDVALVCAPLFHVAALNMVTMPTILTGGTILLMGQFDPGTVLDLIERRGVTVMFGVPAMFNAMSQHVAWRTTDLSSLRRALCGGAPVPLATIRTYMDRGVMFLQGYGMTETSPGALFLGAERAAEKAGTAGVASFFTDVRVIDSEGHDVRPGEKGEVVVAGPNVMAGYWNLPDATEEAMTGEWFHSGDVAVVDDEGYVTIVDRKKDVIISGGENIYPAEVEDALYSHPAVAECAVIGVPDERWGEVGRAVVVLRPDAYASETALLDHLDGRLAGYKRPKSVMFTDSLPRSGAGKVLKNQLRTAFGDSG